MTATPQFAALSRRQCLAVLKRNGVGRIAYTFRDRVDIEPIGYVHDGSWLYGRTSRGAKLVQLKHNPWVAFEVDEIEGPFDWRSVVVHGTVYFLNPGGEEHEDFPRALRLFRRRDARVLGTDDPAPERTIFFRIHLDEVTGRMASSAPVSPTRGGASGRGR
jgi:nitroimidazol reductase NimA-like FMN-containing flavoprotein (pyridoxamine 5'-phosphate oxidase superfamily)